MLPPPGRDAYETLNDVVGEAVTAKRRREKRSACRGRHCADVARRRYERQARRDLDEPKFTGDGRMVHEIALAGLP